MGIKDIAVGRSDVYLIPVEEIFIKEGWNARDMSDQANIDHVEELAKSIAENGQKEPIRVYMEDGKLYVSNGHSRRMAVDIARKKYKADIKAMKVIVEDKNSNEADRTFTMITSNSGKPLSPLEMGAVFKRMIEFGWSEKELISKTGYTGQRVRDLLQLQAASPEIQKMIKAGKVSPTLAQQTIRQNKNDMKIAAGVLKDAVTTATGAGKVKATGKHVAGSKTNKPKAAKKPAAAPKDDPILIVRNTLSGLTPVPGGFMITADQVAAICNALDIK